MDSGQKTRENRLRRMAARQGLELRKNPRRDPRAVDYGSYMLVNRGTRILVADFGWDHPAAGDHLDEIESYLTSPHDREIHHRDGDPRNNAPANLELRGAGQ